MSRITAPVRLLADPDRAHLPFLLAGLTFAIAGGFSLAILLPIDAAGGFGLGSRWVALAQAHGHLQTVGFAGLVISGVALRLIPRFTGGRRPGTRLLALIFTVLVLAVLLRALGQSLADHSPFDALMATGAGLEVAAALLFGGAILTSGRRGFIAKDPLLIVIAAAALWFLVQALLGAIWITDTVREGGVALSAGRDTTLVFLQVYGFLSLFVVGIAWRVLPGFAAVPTVPRSAFVATAVLMQVGIALTAGALAWWAETGDRVWQIENAGLLALAAGWIGGVMLNRPWRRPHRLRPAAQPLGRLLQLAMAWLVVAAAVTLFFVLRGFTDSRGLAGPEMDAVRHLIGVGVVLTAIIAMAQIVLPEFALERLTAPAAGRRALLFGIGLSLTAATRAAPGIANTNTSISDHWHIASAGIMGMALIAWFAFLLLRAMWRRPMLLIEIQRRAQGAGAGPRQPRRS